MFRLLLKRQKLVAMIVEEITILKILSMKSSRLLLNHLFQKMVIATIVDLKNSSKQEMLPTLRFCRRNIKNKKRNF
jgi:hypothetical protein